MEALSLIEALERHSDLESGWHENPRNHTLTVTLYFGDKDPRHLLNEDQRLTKEILEFLAQ